MDRLSAPDPRTRQRGWFLPAASMVFLESGGGLVLLDAEGAEVGRFLGAAADALRDRLRGGPVSLLLATLQGVAPGLEQTLEGEALALSPASLLARTQWRQLFVELTARCNERCLHCYASSGPDREEALQRATVEAVLRDAASMGFEIVQFTGGEALLCPFLSDMARLAQSLKIPTVEVYTNGVLLGERRYAELREWGVSFAFSLYAASPDVHDSITRLPGSHQLTVAAIRRAVLGGSPVRVSVIATDPSLDAEASAAAQLARDLGVVSVGLEISHAVGRGDFHPRELLAQGAESETHAAASPDAHGRELGGGKACVLPDGWVTPCIFSRDVRLGRVGPHGGLRAALETPSAQLRACDEDTLREDLRRSCERLRCAECRLPSVLLA